MSLQRQNLLSHADRIFKSGQFILGTPIVQFEEAFARYLKVKHCISCGNGADALEISLAALGIGPNDEVIVPSISWLSTAYAVSNVGAKVVFVDIHPNTYNLDVTKLGNAIGEKTKAVIAVHLFGNTANISSIAKVCKDHKIALIEDCAQAHGSDNAGQFGDVATFSFYPTKTLGALGDGGAVATNSLTLARSIRSLANYGFDEGGFPKQRGRNSRLDTIQAVWLSENLNRLEEYVFRRNQIAKYYSETLGTFISPQLVLSKSGYYAYTFTSNQRDALKDYLKSRTIETKVYHSSPLPYLPAYQNEQSYFPASSVFCEQNLSLPIWPELTDEEVNYVTESIKSFFKK